MTIFVAQAQLFQVDTVDSRVQVIRNSCEKFKFLFKFLFKKNLTNRRCLMPLLCQDHKEQLGILICFIYYY
jgi:hypothetical protein